LLELESPVFRTPFPHPPPPAVAHPTLLLRRHGRPEILHHQVPFDEYARDWEWVDGGESSSSDEKEVYIYGLTDDFGFGSAPSADEVNSAVNQLTQFVGSGRYNRLIRDKYGDDEMENPTVFELDWKEPSSPQFYRTRALQPYGSEAVHRAFHLLQSDQSVQVHDH
ncbi:hypothetical protein LINPERHAP1_LOCUS10051, partial [Linum perenne]